MNETYNILILRRQPHWAIVGAELRRVAAFSRYMEPKAAVRAQWVEDDDSDDLRQLATICEELQPDSLFTRYANKKVFRRTDDFWASDDTTLQQHVKRTCDQRLHRAVSIASKLDIPILYAPDAGTSLHIDDRLTADFDTTVTPVMAFRRHESGITYRLKLRMEPKETGGESGAVLCDDLSEHGLTVLGHAPGLFIFDDRLLSLAEGFSGKLLLPFAKKDVVEIPRHMENEYFRRFILRNVARAEIEAEGFDITDTCEQLLPVLNVETAIDGRPMLSLRFRYGDNEYAPDSTQNGRVTLTATDDGGFRFTRQMRDRSREEHYLRELAKKEVPAPLFFTGTTEMVAWLRENGPWLRSKGFDVVQPHDSAYYIGPLDVEQSDTWHGDWLQTDVTIVLDDGGLRIPFLDLRDAILRGDEVYMLPSGELLLIPPEWLKRYSDLLLLGMPKGKGFQRHRCQVAAAQQSHSPQLSQSAQSPQLFQSAQPSHQPQPPHSLLATLRPYQLAGYQWLWQNFEAQTGCCLSDEMGLGKTLQTIALLLKYKEQYEVSSNDTSVRPTRRKGKKKRGDSPQPGLLFTEEEMRGEGPSISHSLSVAHHPSLVVAPASVVHNWCNELQHFAPSLTVCSYTGSTTLRREKRRGMMRCDVVVTTYRTLVNDIDYLADQRFAIAVFDESQAFKTASSQVHSAVVRIEARYRMALSGTPVENSLMELWSLMNVLTPTLLGSQRGFHQTFVAPIARHFEEERTTLLRRLIAPYFLKRTKEEVLADLPPRQDEVIVCPMTDDQARQYAEELSRARNEVLAAAATSEALGGEGSADRRFYVLAAIQRLRHIANGEGKLNALFDHLEALRGTGHKVLLFSEYVSMLRRLAQEMETRGWDYDLLTGQTRDREQVISHFQQTPACQFFLISLKAGGVGLNLTAADYVMLIDPWWNEAAEEQAIARAHRIGQRQPVFVYRFVSEDTLEQQILTLQERKQSLIDSVLPFISGPQTYSKE